MVANGKWHKLYEINGLIGTHKFHVEFYNTFQEIINMLITAETNLTEYHEFYNHLVNKISLTSIAEVAGYEHLLISMHAGKVEFSRNWTARCLNLPHRSECGAMLYEWINMQCWRWRLPPSCLLLADISYYLKPKLPARKLFDSCTLSFL